MTQKYEVCYNHDRIYCGIADRNKGEWINADDAMLSVALYPADKSTRRKR